MSPLGRMHSSKFCLCNSAASAHGRPGTGLGFDQKIPHHSTFSAVQVPFSVVGRSTGMHRSAFPLLLLQERDSLRHQRNHISRRGLGSIVATWKKRDHPPPKWPRFKRSGRLSKITLHVHATIINSTKVTSHGPKILQGFTEMLLNWR
jgi:hypothetical protein